MPGPTPSNDLVVTAIADWMLLRVKSDGVLGQEEVVDEITRLFGEEYLYENEHGNLAIGKEVLKLFRTLSEKSVVWDRSERHWRLRDKNDAPGRAQS